MSIPSRAFVFCAILSACGGDVTPSGSSTPATPLPSLVVHATLDDAPVETAFDVNLDADRVGALGEVVEVAEGTYQVTVGDSEDLTWDGRPIVRMGDQTFVSRPATAEVVLDDDPVQVDVVLDVYVDTTLPCLVTQGSYRDAECTSSSTDEPPQIDSEEEIEVSFRVDGRDLQISNRETGMGSHCEVDGSSVFDRDDWVSAQSFTNDAVALQVSGNGDCAPFIWWECPPPQ